MSDRTGLVPLVIDSPIDVVNQPITVGVPLPRGLFASASSWTLSDSAGTVVPVQTEPLAFWADGSVRWLLIDFIPKAVSAGQHEWHLRAGTTAGPVPHFTIRTQLTSCDLDVDTGAAVFKVSREPGQSLLRVNVGGREILDSVGAQISLTDSNSMLRCPRFDHVEIENVGPLRTTICLTGSIAGSSPCRVVVRICFFAGTSLVRLRLTVHNPRRARHRGNLWDLGDAGSIRFRDLTIRLGLSEPQKGRIRWSEEPGEPFRETLRADNFEIYQDSSGGENWKSRNHVNSHGEVPVRFRGYRVRAEGNERIGMRANPTLRWLGPKTAVSVAIPEFWQQFPKAIETDDRGVAVRLFPLQFGDLFELQGGEQKTHTVWLHFGDTHAIDDVLNWVHRPLIAKTTPEWYAVSGSFSDLLPPDGQKTDRFDCYLEPVLNGPTNLIARREIIDEYGWRNFGDIYADHENAYYDGPKPIISHYNNQFDSVFGAILQFARTGDRRWREISDPLARHVIDIDIYHTVEDKAAYSGGLFWHSNHYQDAATSTHRTYSRVNRQPGTPSGGGPSSENNFTTGLLYYFYMTGDRLASEAVRSLADWVVRMDDGKLTIFGLLDSGPTGLASCTREASYHGPGRGSGFSVNALLDGWLLTGQQSYLNKAEELIRRCIHPCDDIAALDLLNAEQRWSYTVFLSVLIRYLRHKIDANNVDSMYAYAHAALLHYADWMAQNERPYLDDRDRLEYPTETWAAQDFRKANVLRLSAAFAEEPLREQLQRRGAELAERAWSDLLAFDSRHVARPVAIMLTEGTRDQFCRHRLAESVGHSDQLPNIGQSAQFVPQKQRIRKLLLSPRRLFETVFGLVFAPGRPRNC